MTPSNELILLHWIDVGATYLLMQEHIQYCIRVHITIIKIYAANAVAFASLRSNTSTVLLHALLEY